MSDAIVLDVVDTAPMRLDAGDADPIARKEIAELAERMDAIEADGSVTTTKLADGAVTDAKLVQTGGVLEDVRNLKDAYGEQSVILSDKSHASYVVSGDEATITITGLSLFASNHPVYTNASIDGFYVAGLDSLPNVLGIVIGKDASNNYYFFTALHNTVGQVFRVTPTGSYARVVDDSYNGSRFTKVSIDSFQNGILTVSIWNVHGLVATITRDLTTYAITNTVVGFIPYAASANTFSVPFANFRVVYKQFIQPSVLDELLPMLVNQTKEYHIKLVGDSITAGVGGTGYDPSSTGGGALITTGVYQNVRGTCWANSLKAYLEAKFAGVTVTNNGYSGATSQWIVEHFSDFVSETDDLVICMIGTNNRNTTGDLNRLYINLQRIVDRTEALGIPIILMSCIPASIANEQVQSVLHMEDIDMIVGAVARKNEVPWISVYKLMREYLQSTSTTLDSLLADGLHPNDAGYAVMYQLITKALGFATPIDGYTWTPSVISATS